MQRLLTGILILIIVLMSSCRKDFDTVHSQGDFRIEKDTLFLDSVFTNISSHTYRFKIYNTSSKEISINKIHLEKGEESFYRLNVDGNPGKSFENVLIHANDSIFVFVEVTADINQLENPVYEEKLLVEDDSKTEDVLLTAFVKDANFYYPERYPDGSHETLILYTDPESGDTIETQGFFLEDDTTFTDEKPIVIYGHMAVPAGHTLTIEQGAHLYFHFNSGLIVWEDATLKVNGSLGHEVIFEDDRMEEEYEHHPGLWNYIWLRQNSKNNEINYAIIKNAEIGVKVFPTENPNPVLQIKNTQIYDSSLAGIFSVAGSITGENLVMNNFGISAINIQLGGSYDFKHCTFANYSGGNRNEKSATVFVSNYIKTEDETYLYDLQKFNMSNCIVYGNAYIEFFMDKNEEAGFNYAIDNSLIRFEDPQNRFADIAEVNFSDTAHYNNIILNEDPEFEDAQENKMAIIDTSPCVNQGNPATAQAVPLDIRQINRTAAPDLGAYQHIFSNKK